MSEQSPEREPGAGRGCFIVLEGIDGAGTTTQARLLTERLRESGGRSLLTREPSDGPIGVLIRQILTGRVVARPGEQPAPVDGASVALLFAADRVDHLRSEIEPALEAGVHVVSDRYVLSSLAYQSLDNDPEWVETINARARVPDLTLFLDVDAKVAMSRRAASRESEERFEPLEMQERVAATYRRLCESSSRVGRLVRVDGALPAGEVEAAIWTAVQDALASL